jgi:hypothetical protein
MKMVVFETAVVDPTEKLGNPVDVLFRTQLGGGTDVKLALRGRQREMLERVGSIVGRRSPKNYSACPERRTDTAKLPE